MNNTTINKFLIISVIFLISIYFITSNIMYRKYSVFSLIENTEKYIIEEKWDEAIDSSNKLKDTWKKLSPLIMTNYAEAETTIMEEYIRLLVGGVRDHDSSTALSSVYYVKELFNNMRKLVPEP